MRVNIVKSRAKLTGARPELTGAHLVLLFVTRSIAQQPLDVCLRQLERLLKIAGTSTTHMLALQ